MPKKICRLQELHGLNSQNSKWIWTAAYVFSLRLLIPNTRWLWLGATLTRMLQLHNRESPLSFASSSIFSLLFNLIASLLVPLPISLFFSRRLKPATNISLHLTTVIKEKKGSFEFVTEAQEK